MNKKEWKQFCENTLSSIRNDAGLDSKGQPINHALEFPLIIKTKELNFRDIQESKIKLNAQ